MKSLLTSQYFMPYQFFLKTAQVSASGLGPGGLDSSGVANSNPKPPGREPPICTP